MTTTQLIYYTPLKQVKCSFMTSKLYDNVTGKCYMFDMKERQLKVNAYEVFVLFFN